MNESIEMSSTKIAQQNPCFECDDGILETVIEDYSGTLANGKSFIVPKVPMERCNLCGDTVIGIEGNRKID